MNKTILEKLETALENTWQAIGSDVMEMAGTSSITKSEVIEMVLDANRVEMYGDLEPEILDIWVNLGIEECRKIADKAFIYKHYGY